MIMYLHSLNSHILKTILVEVEQTNKKKRQSLPPPRETQIRKGISKFIVVEPSKNRETHLERGEERGKENYVKRRPKPGLPDVNAWTSREWEIWR